MELALVLPVLVMVMLLVFQVVLIGKDQVLTIHAAREGARAAAVGDDARSAVARLLPGAAVTISGGGRVGAPIAVHVRYVARTELPLVGVLLPDATLEARLEMRTERVDP